jgi:hypothetical protein
LASMSTLTVDKTPSNESFAGDEEKAAPYESPEEQQRTDGVHAPKEDATPAPPPNAGPGPPPNGGLVAWLQVLGSFCLFFNTWGILKYASRLISYIAVAIR